MFRRSRSRFGRPEAPSRKLLQLCRQVHEALSWVLGSIHDDDRLVMCSIDAVVPLPGNNRLMVRVHVPNDIPLVEAADLLARVAPALRVEVAQSITRRKVPELVFIPVRMIGASG